jgi:diguanylate cyclase (GGDEF)-like protein/PAS domain S-box-containing protein
MDRNIVEFINSNRNILDLILDMVPIPLFVKDRAGRYIDCNKAFMEFFSFRREELIGKTVYEIWKKDEADVFFAKDNELFVQGGLQMYETQITSFQGTLHVVQFYKQVFVDPTGATAGFIGAIFDLTAQKRMEKALAELAVTDELTGLPNRRDGMARFEGLQQAREKGGEPYCIAMVDIDHFKQLNDKYGHREGDNILNSFANLMKSMLRSTDTCFRYGGEEFIILLPETEIKTGLSVVERLRQAWACNPLIINEFIPVKSTISIGLVQAAGIESSVEQLLQLSDKALYAAKNAGRNRTVCIQSSQQN